MGHYCNLVKRRKQTAYYMYGITLLNEYSIRWGYIYWFTSLWKPVMLFFPFPLRVLIKNKEKKVWCSPVSVF